MEEPSYNLYWLDCEVVLNLGLIVKAFSKERAETYVQDSAKFRREFVEFLIEYLQNEEEDKGDNLQSFKITNSEKYTAWTEEELDRIDIFVKGR